MKEFDSINQIEHGSHLYQFYKTKEDYVSSMVSFYRTGLSKGDACIWLVSDAMGIKNIQTLAERMIPDFLLYLCTGQMTMLSANEWYLKNGCFNEEQAMANAQNFIQKTLDKGYTGIRGSGDVGAIPKSERYKLEPYETKMHHTIKDLPLMAVCAYPIDECSLGEVRMVIEHHDHRMIARR